MFGFWRRWRVDVEALTERVDKLDERVRVVNMLLDDERLEREADGKAGASKVDSEFERIWSLVQAREAGDRAVETVANALFSAYSYDVAPHPRTRCPWCRGATVLGKGAVDCGACGWGRRYDGRRRRWYDVAPSQGTYKDLMGRLEYGDHDQGHWHDDAPEPDPPKI